MEYSIGIKLEPEKPANWAQEWKKIAFPD